MPSRIIKETICTSENLAEISAEAERLFWRLVTKADDFGRYYGNPRIIASMCFPLGPPSDEEVTSWLKELANADLIETYTGDDGKRYVHLTSWNKHQQQRATKSKFPEPTSIDNICDQSPTSDVSSNGNQLIANVPVNENENVNDKLETKTGTCPSGASVAQDDFDRFWSVYPRRVGKQDALKAWKKLKPDAELVDQIVAGVERWKLTDQWTKDGGGFICYPATFLRGRRWEEDDKPDLPPERASPAAKNYDDDEDFLKGG